MPRTTLLIVLLAGLSLTGAASEALARQNGHVGARAAWMLFLLGIPFLLTGLVWAGWRWAAMACVVYATVGLALDVATLVGLAAGKGGIDPLLPLCGLSGLLNFSLIVAGGQAFVRAFERP